MYAPSKKKPAKFMLNIYLAKLSGLSKKTSKPGIVQLKESTSGFDSTCAVSGTGDPDAALHQSGDTMQLQHVKEAFISMLLSLPPMYPLT